MNYAEWLQLNQKRCSEGRHSFRTARRLRLVLVYERFPVRLQVRRSMRCWVCPLNIPEPRELVEREREMYSIVKAMES